MIIQKFPSGPLSTNAILLGCEETHQAAVIDPSSGSTKAILQEARLLGLKIEKILLTHSHWDHIADVYELQQKTDALVYVHPLDAGNLTDPGSDGLQLYFPIRGVEPDRSLDEAKKIQVGNIEITVIHTPGHSPGCVCFYLKKEQVLFAGDTLFKGTMGGLHLPTARPALMWGSLDKLAALPAAVCVISGHGEDTTIGNESWLRDAKKLFGEF